MTLEEFLREQSKTDFELRSFVDENGEVSFYIHANDLSQSVISFKVDGNYLVRI